LLLRLCLAIPLIYFATAGLSEKSSEPITIAQNLIAAAGGIFLLAGLWTPVIGTLVAVDELWTALAHYSLPHEHTWIHVLLAGLSASAAMLGPGAWSIDALLFGRKRFDIDRTRSRYPSP
jgi:uncharacterized membrane protein YphA (DoxX/SURF4 family)